MGRKGLGLDLYSSEATPSMESGDWERDLAAVNMESVDLVGLRKKMMAVSLTRGPGKAATQGAGSGCHPKRGRGKHSRLAGPTYLNGPLKKEGKEMELGRGRGKGAAASARLRRRKGPSGAKEWEERKSPFLFLFKFSKTISKWILNSFLSFQAEHTIQNIM
jgi:mono/diheme cytochrome c family protein